MRTIAFLWAVSICGSLLVSASASAGTLAFDLTGTFGRCIGCTASGSTLVGNSYTLRIIAPTEATIDLEPDSTLGEFDIIGPPYSFRFSSVVTELNVDSEYFRISVADDFDRGPPDEFISWSQSDTVSFTYFDRNMAGSPVYQFTLASSTALEEELNAFTGDSLPSVSILAAMHPILFINAPDGGFLVSDVDSYQVTVVPLSPALLLLLSALPFATRRIA